MYLKLKMPVTASTNPSIETYNYFDLKKTLGLQEGYLPAHDSLMYRGIFFLYYQYNRIRQFLRTRSLKGLISSEYQKHIDDWDQEHCLILTEGTHVGIL